jgi:hypothetical protein
MRLTFSCLLLVLSATLVRAADLEFVRVWPNWRAAESFERIGEFFGRGEQTGGEVIVRTQPDSRDGYYFLVRVKHGATPPANARFELNVIRPDTPVTQTFTFPARFGSRQTVFQLGVTGFDWPDGRQANPVAWRLALVDPEGRVLVEQKSFLWEKPVK